MNLTLSDVLKLTGGKLINETPEIEISGVATLDGAVTGEIAFLGNEKYFNDFLATKASAVLVPPSLPQSQTSESSPAALMHPPSCRGPPWKTCCAHTPPSPARTTPPRAV